MNTARKLNYISEEAFSPRRLPEIVKQSNIIKKNHANIYYSHIKTKPLLFETNDFIIRRFNVDDASEIQNLAINKQNSPMHNYDHRWPTDKNACIKVAEFFSQSPIYWAVIKKSNLELIGLITYNEIIESAKLDLGHIWHTTYQNNILDYDALSLMIEYAFDNFDIKEVCARNPKCYAPQINPFIKMGFEITSEDENASIVNDENDNPIIFHGCEMIITRERWFNNGNPK